MSHLERVVAHYNTALTDADTHDFELEADVVCLLEEGLVEFENGWLVPVVPSFTVMVP